MNSTDAGYELAKEMEKLVITHWPALVEERGWAMPLEDHFAVADAIVVGGTEPIYLLEVRTRAGTRDKFRLKMFDAAKHEAFLEIYKLLGIATVIAWKYDDGIDFLRIPSAWVSRPRSFVDRRNGHSTRVVYFDAKECSRVEDSVFEEFFGNVRSQVALPAHFAR